jgi:hypothetical protein
VEPKPFIKQMILTNPTLVNGKREADTHKIVPNFDKFGCGPGIYLFNVKIENNHTRVKLFLMK